ncbi:DUF4144 family protein [Shewanella sp. 10N.286.54.B9]|uniref:DUF4144 family protein n=1 Tax=Shewanella sp. 10N.286.54.B9 TaxID=3229719 RepID=UPI00354D119F
MTMQLAQLRWPIILLQKGSDDLLRIESLTDWCEQTAMLGVLQDSVIIDYDASSYLITAESTSSLPQLQRTYAQLTLEQLNQSVQRYASQNGHCCTAKFSANNIKQIFDTVQYLEQI